MLKITSLSALVLSFSISTTTAQAQTYSKTVEPEHAKVTVKCGNRNGNRICQIITVKNGQRTIENIVTPMPQQPANRPMETIYQH